MRNVANLRVSLGAADRPPGGFRADESCGAPPSLFPGGGEREREPACGGPAPQGRAQAVAVGPSLGELGDT